MSAELLRIADAVVTQLNGVEQSIAFVAVRLYQPNFELKDMNTLHVSVVPRTKTTKPLTRSTNETTFVVDVGVQKKFTALANAELDPLVTLVDEMAAQFDRKRLLSVPEAACMATKPDPVYSPEHMEQLRQFTSILTLTFKVMG